MGRKNVKLKEYYQFISLLHALFQQSTVLLDLCAGRQINVFHLSVAVTNGHDEATADVFFNRSRNLDLAFTTDDGFDCCGYFFDLGSAHFNGSLNVDRSETSFGLHDASVDGGNLGDEVETVVFSHGVEKVESEWGHFDFTSGFGQKSRIGFESKKN